MYRLSERVLRYLTVRFDKRGTTDRFPRVSLTMTVVTRTVMIVAVVGTTWRSSKGAVKGATTAWPMEESSLNR